MESKQKLEKRLEKDLQQTEQPGCGLGAAAAMTVATFAAFYLIVGLLTPAFFVSAGAAGLFCWLARR